MKLSDPSCLSYFDWVLTSNGGTPLGYLDNPSNPTVYILPDQGGMTSSSNFVNLRLYANGSDTYENFYFMYDVIGGTAPPLCTVNQNSPKIQSYE